MDEPQAPLTEARAIIEAHRRADSLLTAHELGVLEAALSTAPVQGVSPALPEPAVTSNVTDSVMRSHEVRSYSEAQMRDYGEACVRAALASAPHPPSNTLGDAASEGGKK